MKALIVAAALVAASGCASFEKSEYSGVRENRLALVLIEPGRGGTDLAALKPVIEADRNLLARLEEDCGVPPEFKTLLVPELVPLVSAFGKLIFDLFMDGQIRKAEGLKKAAQGSYADRRLLSADELRRQTCALAVRYKEGEKNYGLAALVRLARQADGRSFVIEPVYVRARNAVVVTEKPSAAAKAASIAVAIGVSVKGVARQKTGVPALQPIGEGVVAVPGLELGPDPKALACVPRPHCPTSDLIPYPDAGKDVVSVTLSVAESGRIGVDFDQSIAELKAIKEALGPALKETLKETFKD
jgi:hypothetical protein